MMEEFYTDELVIYTVTPRKDKGDEYSKRKIQKDRKKLYEWVIELLKENELIIDYIEDDKLVTSVCTMKFKHYGMLPIDEVPIEIESYRGDELLRMNHLPVVSFPGKQRKLIHIDNVRKFILKNDNVQDIANRLYYTKY